MSSHHGDHLIVNPPRLEEVSDEVYAYVQPDGSWWINNTGFLVGDAGVVSVDSCATERRTRAYLEAIASVTHRSVHTLVNTHHHGDHTNGNCLFPAATIIAHEQCRREVLDSVVPPAMPWWTDIEWGAIQSAPPFVTFTEEVTIWVNDVACRVRWVGTPAHTTNDCFVWVPSRSVLFAGDLLFNGGTPFLLMGSVSGAIDVLEKVVRPLGAETIVPGHGDVCGPEVIDEVLGYLRFVDVTARAGREAGLSPLQTALETDLGAYGELLDPERIVGNLHRAYAELSGGERGVAIDLVAALQDMVIFNGGKPLRCLA